MNAPPAPPPRPPSPEDPAEVARRQARLEVLAQESRLEILRSQRQQRESTQSRRLSFFLVFALATAVTWILDHRGARPEVSIAGCVLTIVVFGGWWAFRKPY